MSKEPAYEPAQGAERIICWIIITGMCLHLLLSLFMAAASEDADFHIMQILVPPAVILIAVARLKGWVKQGGGMGGGGP